MPVFLKIILGLSGTISFMYGVVALPISCLIWFWNELNEPEPKPKLNENNSFEFNIHMEIDDEPAQANNTANNTASKTASNTKTESENNDGKDAVKKTENCTENCTENDIVKKTKFNFKVEGIKIEIKIEK